MSWRTIIKIQPSRNIAPSALTILHSDVFAASLQLVQISQEEMRQRSPQVFFMFKVARRSKQQSQPRLFQSSSPRSITVAAESPQAAPLSAAASRFPPVFYLDWDIFRACQVEVPKASAGLPASISGLIGGPERWGSISSLYFSTVHSWLPIVSKKRFQEIVLGNPAGHIRSDYALLILGMDVVMSTSHEHNPRTPAYLAFKQLYLELEIQGIVSIQILQAGILIALFELGHAIFPSAAISVEACVRYGHELGINWGAQFPEKKPFSWVDIEEQNRVWWAIVILDRFIKIGYQRRQFLIEHPSPDMPLPSDDQAFDEGVMPPASLGILHSRSPRKLGRFALTAEASRLLGQVLDHIASDDFGTQLHGEQALLLDNALRALETVVAYEGRYDSLFIMNQTAMCSIAMLLLHESHTSRKSTMSAHFHAIHLTAKTTEVIRISSSEAPASDSEFHPFESCVKEASPFLTTLLYHTAVSNLRLYRENGTQETLDALLLVKDALKLFGEHRWRSGGAYLNVLEAREVSQISI
ncbi:hypothetical protein LOCC1_G003182 [Lachnellula occidentalis]|uniref:Xylanolytic transcriptional activator regulatory domain-containing protein n=1 Tax=Lachnellula occidentalis TaxID=215460 RepID=A0A8H8RXJ0_9HELO|nr:hypothetical protein LOCC1_G003182 [Lachnellula occidentalis]